MDESRSPDPTAATGIDASVPHSARIWNYWMGGKDNFEVDRTAGDAYARTYPGIFDQARQSRQYLIRAVRYLAGEVGIAQFLDIGTGLPTEQNTHQVAQALLPDARIVYVDNDPMVLVHARALLTNTSDEGVTTYVDADLHEPDQVVADARNVLNFTKPIGVMFMGVLGHVATYQDARSIVARVMEAVPPGSHLVHWDGTDTSQAQNRAIVEYAQSGAVPYNLRSPEQIAGFYEGLEILEPGVVPMSEWRAERPSVEPVDGWGAVARKP